MQSEKNNENIFSVLNELATFIQETVNAFAKIGEWCRDNRENIKNFLIEFENFGTCCSAIKKMAQHQIMFSDDVSLDFATAICNSEDVDVLVENYYFNGEVHRINNVIKRCEEAQQLKEYHNLFLQVIESYKKQHYHLACIGMFAIADGMLSDISNLKNSTKFKERIVSIEQKMNDKIEFDTMDRKIFFIQLQLDSLGDNLSNSIFGFSKFSENEPNTLNRHWIVHGRTHKSYSRYDFLKILLWIDQLVFLDKIINSTAGGDEK